MATDHRGRELHAGKRTAQARGWFFQHEDEDGFGATNGFKRNRLNDKDMSFEEDSENGGFSWSVDIGGPTWGYPDGEPYELGRGKQKYDRGGGKYTVTGKAKTPARAMLAAEAMKKRIDEGRDPKTGRPRQ